MRTEEQKIKHAEWMKKYRATPRGIKLTKEYKKRYRLRHPQRVARQLKRWRVEHPHYQHCWRLLHPGYDLNWQRAKSKKSKRKKKRDGNTNKEINK